MTVEEAWTLVAANERRLRRAVRRMLPRARRGDLDEAYQEVVFGTDSRGRVRCIHWLLETYDPCHPSGASRMTHLVANVQWCAYKWVHGRNGSWDEPPVVHSLDDVSSPALGYGGKGASDGGEDAGKLRSVELILAREMPVDHAPEEPAGGDLLERLLGGLQPRERDLVIWHAAMGCTFTEIADHLGLSQRRVSRDYRRAVRAVRSRSTCLDWLDELRTSWDDDDDGT